MVDKLRQMIVPLHVGETLPLNEPVSGHGNCDWLPKPWPIWFVDLQREVRKFVIYYGTVLVCDPYGRDDLFQAICPVGIRGWWVTFSADCFPSSVCIILHTYEPCNTQLISESLSYTHSVTVNRVWFEYVITPWAVPMEQRRPPRRIPGKWLAEARGWSRRNPGGFALEGKKKGNFRERGGGRKREKKKK